MKQVQLGESGKAGETGKPAVKPVVPAKMKGSAPSAADVTKQRFLTEGTGLTQLDLAVQTQKPKNFSGFRTGGSGVTRTGGTFSSPYHVEKDRLRKEAEDEFAHNMTDWGQTAIRNFAVNPDFPQGAGLVNYIQLLLQSPKGIEYERYTAAEQEAEKTKQIEKITDWANQNGRSPFLSKLYGEEKNGILNAPTGLSLLTAPLRGADYVLDALETAYTGAPLPDSTPNFTETTQALREGVSQDMGKAGQFVYNAALSTADSLIAGWMGGGSVSGGIILGLGAASDTAHDIINRGGTAEDALIGGAVSGIMEGVFEKLSLGQLNAMKAMPVNSARDVLVNMAKSVVTNASEEFTTELANTIFDTIFMGELSTYEMTVEGYLSQGKSEAEARRLANMDLLARLGESAAAGALTGALFGSGASADSYYRSRLAAQGEASLRAGEMPTRGQLQVMNLSESEARGAMVLLGMEQIDDEADGTAKRNLLPGEARPTWRQSEVDAAEDFPNYTSQQSFLNRKAVPYGTKGSVRPDYYISGHSVEIKNYNIETVSGRRNLVYNVQHQYFQRMNNLPEGTLQSVMVDIRGQRVTDDVLNELYDDLMERTDKNLEVLFKMN